MCCDDVGLCSLSMLLLLLLLLKLDLYWSLFVLHKGIIVVIFVVVAVSGIRATLMANCGSLQLCK